MEKFEIPKIFIDLISASQKIVTPDDFIIVPCANADPIVSQPQSYSPLDKAINRLMNGKQTGSREIFELCYLRDFVQKGNNALPLIMFYFPLVAEKINKQAKMHTRNTQATLKILGEYYKNGDIQGFLDTYDTTGKYFNEIYTDKISHFRDSRYSFLYKSFVPSSIQYCIETVPLKFSFWTGLVKQYAPGITSTISFANVSKKAAVEVIKTFLWVQELFPDSKKLSYDIKIFFCGNALKMLPTNPGAFLTPKHVNSGLSLVYSGSNKRQIFIFREEECLKVLLHEFLHTYSCHNAIDGNKKIMAFLDSINVETTPLFSKEPLDETKDKDELDRNYIGSRNPNEALTEITANILNIIRLITQSTQSHQNFIKFFGVERKFSLFQCAKILHHFGITDVAQILPGGQKLIKQTTNVIPYFLFRAMLYHDPVKLFKWYQTNNSLCYFGRGSQELKVCAGTKILEDMLTKFTPEFKNDINNLIKRVSKNDLKGESHNSLRMTLFG